jgi:hypothetical protein
MDAAALGQISMNILIYFGVGLLSAGIQQTVSDQPPVAFVETITGEVKVYAEGSTKPQVLDPVSDRGLILNWSDKVECSSKAALMGVMPAKKPNSINLCSNPWNSDARSREVEKGLSAKAMEKLGEYARAGRPKGDENPIFDPPDHGSVLAENLIVRWRTRPALDKFTAVLKDGNTELARVADVDGAKGELDSSIFRQALMSHLDSSMQNQELRIVFGFENGSEQAATFAVLTHDEERRLAEELTQVSQSGLFRFVQRAAIYDSFRLYRLVASEYDGALTEAPQSRILLRAAMQAYSRTGDLRHARELRDKLQQAEQMK